MWGHVGYFAELFKCQRRVKKCSSHITCVLVFDMSSSVVSTSSTASNVTVRSLLDQRGSRTEVYTLISWIHEIVLSISDYNRPDDYESSDDDQSEVDSDEEYADDSGIESDVADSGVGERKESRASTEDGGVVESKGDDDVTKEKPYRASKSLRRAAAVVSVSVSQEIAKDLIKTRLVPVVQEFRHKIRDAPIEVLQHLLHSKMGAKKLKSTARLHKLIVANCELVSRMSRIEYMSDFSFWVEMIIFATMSPEASTVTAEWVDTCAADFKDKIGLVNTATTAFLNQGVPSKEDDKSSRLERVEEAAFISAIDAHVETDINPNYDGSTYVGSTLEHTPEAAAEPEPVVEAPPSVVKVVTTELDEEPEVDEPPMDPTASDCGRAHSPVESEYVERAPSVIERAPSVIERAPSVIERAPSVVEHDNAEDVVSVVPMVDHGTSPSPSVVAGLFGTEPSSAQCEASDGRSHIDCVEPVPESERHVEDGDDSYAPLPEVETPDNKAESPVSYLESVLSRVAQFE